MIGWLVETLLTVSILLVLVLLLRGPVARTFGAGWAYALWAVPAARVVLPPLPQLTPDISLPAATFIPVAAGSAAPSAVHAGPGQWVPLMLAIWAGGAVIFMTLQWLAYRDFLQQLGASARPARPPSYGGIMTLVSEAAEGPLALGLVQRRIVLPSDFLRRYSVAERRLALEHELTHHRRGDIWWNMAATMLLALNWFNPIAWVAFRAFRADQELSCDAAVAARASAEERCDYARAMVKSASRPGLIGACALNSASALKLRLRMMRCHRISGTRRAGGVAALTLFITAGFAVGAPDYVPAEPLPHPTAPAASRQLASIAPRAAPLPLVRASLIPSRSTVEAQPSPQRSRRHRAAPSTRAKAAPAPSGPPPATGAAVSLSPAPAPAPLLAALAPAPVVEPVPARPRSAFRRVVRIERRDVVVRPGEGSKVVLFTATELHPRHSEDAGGDDHGADSRASGGSMRFDALARIVEAKAAAIHNMRFRAPDVWDEGKREDCGK